MILAQTIILLQRVRILVLLLIVCAVSSCGERANTENATSNASVPQNYAKPDLVDAQMKCNLLDMRGGFVRELTSEEVTALSEFSEHAKWIHYKDEDIACDMNYFSMKADGVIWYFYHHSLYSQKSGRSHRLELAGIGFDELWVDNTDGVGNYAADIDFTDLIAWAAKN